MLRTLLGSNSENDFSDHPESLKLMHMKLHYSWDVLVFES